jgi:hypothetical protein
MASKTKDFMRKVQNTKSDAIIFATVVTAVLLFGGTTVSGLFPESVAVMDAPKAFAQQQNQTTNATTPSSINATNATIAAAYTYNEMLNPRQIEYPAHLGFNDLHIEAIRHIDPNATQAANQSGQQQQQDLFNLIVHHHCKVYDDMTAACLI